MRPCVWILLLAASLAPPAVAAPPGVGERPRAGRLDKGLDGEVFGRMKPGFAIADGYMAQGQPRRAILIYRSMLERDPEDADARFGLALAEAALWDCGEPLAVLQAARGGASWTADAAAAESQCLELNGELAQAVAAAEEAWTLEPSAAHALRRAHAGLRAADAEVVGMAARDLDALFDAQVGLDVIAVWMALETGAPDFDLRVSAAIERAELAGAREARARLLALDGRRWLDLGDPVAALAVFRRAIVGRGGDPEIAAWSHEATRRVGDALSASLSLERVGLRRAGGVFIDGVRARAAIDLGDLDRASAWLDAYGDLDHEELLASRWYLARARGDADAMAALAARWAALNRSPDRSLEQLISIYDR